ncbi:MAG: hypothetical protein QOK10_817 [Pseudonocardiales bacterium]|jgi:hypothetical protein|nr:hypothetical protein [Pseudonocardiales bacterium]
MSVHVYESSIDLYWLPLGAGGRSVRWNGRLLEAVTARRDHRATEDLYHSALEVRERDRRFVIEMAPVWDDGATDRGVVSEGPVGARWLGRSRLFRYEIRRWRDGRIADVAEAVASPQRMSDNTQQAADLLEVVTSVPSLTWGRDELGAGDMWNSNSLTSWLLARTGHDMTMINPPPHGRAPGWHAGLALASRQDGCRRHVRGNRAERPAEDLYLRRLGLRTLQSPASPEDRQAHGL